MNKAITWPALSVSVAATIALCVACGSGGGTDGGASGSTPPPTGESVILASSRTPWTSGSLGVEISPAPTASQSVQCSIDAAAAVDCAAGSVAYDGLAVGSHTVVVEISGGGRPTTSTSLPWTIFVPEVIVYGGTPAGISAALAAARLGRSVVLLEPSHWIGGMMAGGLAKSDVSLQPENAIGGIADEFFGRTQDREEASGACPDSSACPTHYDFEPRVALEVFTAMLAEHPLVSVERDLPVTSVGKNGARIVSVETARGPLEASVFVDASYEGDLAVLAGVQTTTEREALVDAAPGSSTYGNREDDAGVGTFSGPYGLEVDPYVVPGVPSSGTIAFVEAKPATLPARGTADHRLQAYNFRLCVTDDPTNRIPFSRPADYDAARYEGSARVAEAMAASGRTPLDELYFNPARTVLSADRVHYKRDLNGGSPFSTDMTFDDWNQAYPDADADGRERIAADYRDYIEGALYTWQTDPRFGALNDKVASFGYCRDEFADNGHWPYRLYARETRRMVGEYVMNENDVLRNGRRRVFGDGIGLAGYSMDSHIRQITVKRGASGRDVIVSEGFEHVLLPDDGRPYPVSYRALLPRATDAENLLNPVTLSSTSLAYSSMRMEPTFMVLGQAAGTAAALAVRDHVGVHDLSFSTLRAQLRSDGQLLDD